MGNLLTQVLHEQVHEMLKSSNRLIIGHQVHFEVKNSMCSRCGYGFLFFFYIFLSMMCADSGGYRYTYAVVVEQADTVDSKSIVSDDVRVQVPPAAPFR